MTDCMRPRLQVLNLVVDEAISETLENDNMALQNMSSVRRSALARGR